MTAVIDVAPSKASVGRKARFKPLRSLLGFLWRHKLRLAAATVALVATALLQLSLGYGVQILIDDGFTNADQAGLRRAIGFILAVGFGMAVGAMTRFYLVSWLGERVSADLRSAVFNNLVGLQPEFFERNQAGEIMSRLTTDTTLLQTLIGSSVSLAARNALSLLGALTMMMITNLKLSMIIMIGVPLTLLPILIFGRRVRALSNRSQQSIAEVGSRAGEILQSIKIVQSYNRQKMEQTAFDHEVDGAFIIAKARVRQRALLTGFAILLLMAAMVGMIWSGGQDVISGNMTGGELGAFVFYAVMLGAAFATLSEVWGDLQRAAGAAERLIELLEETSSVPDTGSVQPGCGQAINIKGLGFYYPSRPKTPALEDLTMTIQPGASLALVGPSGAGKSTLFELLQRFYDPQRGGIYYGDVDIRDIPLATWREKAALVPQSPVLFTGSVRYNIAYGKPEASLEEIKTAASIAHAHEFIAALPEGYESALGAQGVQLSGGQRQRLAIARAVLKDPEILLLDEATSALDTESEFHVQQALAQIVRERTTIIIAHRLSTVVNADQIAVVDRGKVISVGTHKELLTSCELYARLAALQFENT
ncbi:MAG: ATP-binding cassette domain-containing protein [Luminiphilus sp.]|nr:ATP-binding cassette domain-containing protein [Luminiphilus sp.]MDA0630712.1 ABC transporter transmembrane domain-containing protein [Pseudomonadota bacterium]